MQMSSTGQIRKIDRLGRVVLPKNYRRMLGISKWDDIVIIVEGDRIYLEKFRSRCVFCGSREEAVAVNDRFICKACLEEIANQHL